jgi:hypothetical protein
MPAPARIFLNSYMKLYMAELEINDKEFIKAIKDSFSKIRNAYKTKLEEEGSGKKGKKGAKQAKSATEASTTGASTTEASSASEREQEERTGE